MEWLSDHAWQMWLGLAVVLGLAEMASLDLILLMLAIGALAGGGAAVVGLPVLFQVLIAAVAAMALLGLVRPPILKKLHAGPELTVGYDALVGTHGVVTEMVSSDAGLAKLAGEIWTARPESSDLYIEPGARVEVVRIDGATAVVRPLPALDAYTTDGTEPPRHPHS